jgi:S-adenosylmethionine/arginine decarboxylase-like enzyme
MEPSLEEYTDSGAWGLDAGIDAHNCNPETIRSVDKIKQFVVELCDLIGMKRFGECTVVGFGEDERVAGLSMTQFIETSLVSGHFSDQTNTAYIDVFSCKYYDPQVVKEFAQKFFEAGDVDIHVTLRK